MKLLLTGIEWENGNYLYWFDWSSKEDALWGKQTFGPNTWYCAGRYAIGWNFSNSKGTL